MDNYYFNFPMIKYNLYDIYVYNLIILLFHSNNTNLNIYYIDHHLISNTLNEIFKY